MDNLTITRMKRGADGVCQHESLGEFPQRVRMLDWQALGLMQTASGYGRRLTTTREVFYAGRWRRVYCCQFSNAGTCYIGKFDASQAGGALIVS